MRQDLIKFGDLRGHEALTGVMSIENGFLIALVVALVAYLLAALIFPERF